MNQLHRRSLAAVSLLSITLCALPSPGQSTPASQPPQTASPTAPQAEPPPAPSPQGQVLFQSHGQTDGNDTQPAGSTTPQAAHTKIDQPPANAAAQLTDADRSALRITRYDLDIRLTPATAQLTGRARLTVRNTGAQPLPRLALEISSSLTWQSASLDGNALPVAQHLLDTDADHTGRARELILTLPAPLAPGASLTLSTFYTGDIRPDATRLERLGMPSAHALATDWDAITPDATSLRGFGDVLWFPVAAPQLFLSDGTLVPAVARARLEHAAVPVRLRLSIEFAGDPPVAAYFCGRRQPLTALHDDPDAPVTAGSGIATASFPEEPIGVRPLSLFVIPLHETLLAPLPDSASSHPARAANAPSLLAVESTDDPFFPALAQSAERVAPLLDQWLGPHPLSALTVIDHPGQPFEDGPLLVAPLGPLSASPAAPLLAHSLTHAWVQTGQPWMDEGLAEFFSLLWIEQQKGREAAIAQLDALMQPVSAADTPAAPDTAPDATAETETAAESSSARANAEAGQPLIDAYDELYIRRKAAAVWWMLRDIAGEQPLQATLSAWRTQPPAHVYTPAAAAQQAEAFEALLEKTGGKDLAWFFNDWVLHDRGLPALSIADVTPRELPAGPGHGAGWLVAVTVHNAGAAAAEVPLVVRAGQLSVMRRIRILGGSNATERVVMQAPPTEVVVNDGSTPESGSSTHTREIVLHHD